MCLGTCTLVARIARLTQRLNSKFLQIFHHSASSKGAAPFEKFQKMLTLAFEAKCALSRQIALTFPDFFVEGDYTNFLHFFQDFRALCKGQILFWNAYF